MASKYFNHIEERLMSVASLQNQSLAINNYLHTYLLDTEINKMTHDDLTNILYHSELISEMVRKAISNYEGDDLLMFVDEREGITIPLDKWKKENKELIEKELEKEAFRNLKVECKFDGEVLEVFTPLTFKRGFKEKNFLSNYLLSHLLESAIQKWQQESKIHILGAIRMPAIIIMKRVDTMFSLNKICDSDNLENQRIINTMARAVGISDNAINLSLYTTFSLTNNAEEVGTRFYLFAEKDMEKHLDLFKTN